MNLFDNLKVNKKFTINNLATIEIDQVTNKLKIDQTNGVELYNVTLLDSFTQEIDWQRIINQPDFYTESEIDGFLQNKSDTTHNHDDMYYTETELDGMFQGLGSTHDHNDLYYTETELQTSGSQELHWDNITNKPQITLNTDTDISTNSWVLNESDFQSNDQTKVPTQQSTKLYIDNSISNIQGEGLEFNIGTNKLDNKLTLYEEDSVTPDTYIEKSTKTRILMVETSDSIMEGDTQPSYSENGDILLIKETY